MATQKITEKEYLKFVEARLYSENFSSAERETLRAIFFPDLHDLEPGERNTLFTTAVPGISEAELNTRLSALRDEHSPLSKSLRVQFYKYPEKIDKLEKIMREALVGNKEPWI